MAIVDHVPEHLVLAAVGDPGAGIPAVKLSWQDGQISALARHQQGSGGFGLEAGQAVAVALGLAFGAEQLHLDPRPGRTAIQLADPGYDLAAVGQGVQADTGGLHPTKEARMVVPGGRWLDHDQRLAQTLGKGGGQVDLDLLGQVWLAVGLQLFVQQDGPGDFCLVGRQALHVGIPVFGFDLPGAHAQPGMVGHLDRHLRFSGGVQGHQMAVRCQEARLGGTNLDHKALLLAEFLAIGIQQPWLEDDSVLCSALGTAVDGKRGICGHDFQVGQFRLDPHPFGVELFGVQFIVKVHRPGLSWLGLVRCRGDRERLVGREAERLAFLGSEGPFAGVQPGR